jgi:hypothetical protein
VDADGYGYEGHQALIDRLLDDLRTLSPAGIERVADGYEKHAAGGSHPAFMEAERASLHEIEQGNLGARWDELRNRLRDLTEGRNSLISWKAEHGEIGHKAERAANAAALALLTVQRLPREKYVQLASPMAEALPWLNDVAGTPT